MTIFEFLESSVKKPVRDRSKSLLPRAGFDRLLLGIASPFGGVPVTNNPGLTITTVHTSITGWGSLQNLRGLEPTKPRPSLCGWRDDTARHSHLASHLLGHRHGMQGDPE